MIPKITILQKLIVIVMAYGIIKKMLFLDIGVVCKHMVRNVTVIIQKIN